MKRRMMLVGIVIGALGVSGCASTSGPDAVGTDAFIDNTLRQYGIGPNGRTSSPDAVVVDPETGGIGVAV